MFQVETVARTNGYVVLKDIITPFVTTAFGYTSKEVIPFLQKPSPEMSPGRVEPATLAANKPDLEMDDPHAYYYITLCPVSSSMFVDTIYWDGNSFQFSSSRFIPRLDIDYCYATIRSDLGHSLPGDEDENKDDEGEERMLFDHEVTIGALV